ncbi:hypothetical protein PFICI_13265 [Pestalotiopsis fici W106-1]|uniref:DUF7492 domain-containing protein n=1 Tax=Pestalotiopsis fici (strain W106-1 / CGMCC3.15140) TaxID=1229662 RepID=W3WPP0_PESFW|nr:uncharacterized protein PFICI_13265 [Pestalotiopsis fici W106-1]ETS74781.1 hypothetical protein PFICI_13265 [Pestalotiopsis fici W106-1]
MASKIVKTLAVMAAAKTVEAHTWVEMIRRISSSGAFVGETGYAMGHMNRTDTGFADTAVQVKFLDVTSNPAVCGDIGKAGYTNAAYPQLSASPGEYVAMQYAENGHVSFPDLTPRGYLGGNVMIYATTEDVTDVGINDALYSWNAEGTGGNGKGKLIASHFFDDGQCFENPNSSPIRDERAAKTNVSSLLCQSVAQLPEDLETDGTVNLLWIWDWGQNPNIAGENTTEIYTSCMTVNLTASDTDAATSVKAFSWSKNVDISDAAIPGQISTLIEVEQRGTGSASPAAVTDVPVATGGASGNATITATATTTASGSKSTHKSTKTRSRSGITTVTVTADAETVTHYQTITVEAGAGNSEATTTRQSSAAATTSASGLKTSVRSSSSSSSQAGGIDISIAPFLKARSTGQARRLQ